MSDDMRPGDEVPEQTASAGENLCPDCDGTGRRNNGTCPACQGKGTITEAVGGG
jgi:DnaJ-class molecular chaperone